MAAGWETVTAALATVRTEIAAAAPDAATAAEGEAYVARVLTACLNDAERVGVGLYSFGAGGSAVLSSYAAFDRASADAEGRFEVEIAAGADHPGALAILPGARLV